MRRHSLTNIPERFLRGVFVVALVVGCAGDGAAIPDGGSGTSGITISTASGERLAFEPAEMTVAGPGRLEFTFRNGSTLPHNMVFTGGLSGGTRTIVAPATEDEVVIHLPAPGSYPFVCTIHDGMAGAIIVAGPRSGYGGAAG